MQYRKHFCLIVILWSFAVNANFAQIYSHHFADSTLRLDYTFSGDKYNQHIFVDELSYTNHWYGKRIRLSEVPLRGNGQIVIMDTLSNDTLYNQSFSTLFQEWLSTIEAKHTAKSFENTFLVPYPKHPVKVVVTLYDYHDQVSARLVHHIDPNDILIRKKEGPTFQFENILHSDVDNPIRVAFVAEGYRTDEMEIFLQDCRKALNAIFGHEPFKSRKRYFDFVAVKSFSTENGVSEPSKGLWRNTILGAHYDTFYSERYLTTQRIKRLHDLLTDIPYEHIIVLVNSNRYGGGGIFNNYTLTSAHGRDFESVIVHEFGHSFGGLGDEYPYGDEDPMYFPDTEPWEPNLTTLHDFSGKWQHLIDEGKAGLIEGGGYLTKGVWRGCEQCRMRTNDVPEFCPVCQQSLSRLIDFYTIP